MIILHQAQADIASSLARYKVWRAGRRTGKTVYGIEEAKGVAILEGLEQFDYEAKVLYLAPTQVQARDIIWRPLKKEFEKSGAKINESRLEIEVTNSHGTKSLIQLKGWENIDNVRGNSFDFIIMDELDSLTAFLQEFQETVKPLILDRKGGIIFFGTPKDSNPNMKSLEDTYADDPEWAFFHTSSYDNPYLDPLEIDKERKALSLQSFRQEWLAEYGDGSTKLFDPVAVRDMFTVELPENRDRTPYYVVDPAGEGEDTTCRGLFYGLEVWMEQRKNQEPDDVSDDLLKNEEKYKIPRKNLMIDGIGVGHGIGRRNTLKGMTIFKGSFSPVKTDVDLGKLVNNPKKELKPTDTQFENLRAQTYFALSRVVSERKVRIHCTPHQREMIIRELNATVEAEDKRKTQLIPKSEIKRIIGHSPDLSDVLAMRMYYYIIKEESYVTQVSSEIQDRQAAQMMKTRKNKSRNSTR